MPYFRLKFEQSTVGDFISSWSKLYDEGEYSETDYQANLNRNGLLKPDNIQYLFLWKNGMKLSAGKQRTPDKAVAKIATLNSFRQLPSVNESDFLKFWQFACSIVGSGLVFRIFLAHIARPDDFPIVDRYVLRAWNFLINNTIEEPEETVVNYLYYREFVLDLKRQSGKSFREIDKALMAFGQFLSTQYFKSLQR
jgi:hypothetical protein